jgi:hypothetical protein
METQLRRDILEFLTPLPAMQTENGRRALLLSAGLETILSQIDLSGNTGEAVTLLVNTLEQYGTIGDTPALVVFLQEVATQVGQDKQRQIQNFCEQFLKEIRDRNAYDIQHLTVYVASRPTEPEQAPISADIGPNPYKGLAAFQETDAERFFGRERVTQALWEKFCALYERPLDGPTPLRLLVILGPSGSGKSSVARAGLLPKLAAHPLPDKQRTRVAVFTPGTHPLEALALILARIDTSPQTLATKTSEFTKVLKQETDGQWAGVRHIADTLPDIDNQPLILLIDQFEEVYSKDVQLDERRMFLDNLLCAAADPSGHVSVILTLRSDFLGQTQRHPAFNQAITDDRHATIVPVMQEEELREAIAKPAENAGYALDEACVDLLIEQTRDREGALPLLQFALTRIWNGLAEGLSPADTLKQIGGVGGALAGEAQRLYEKLSETDKTIARRAFLALVQLGEDTRDTLRRISVSEIVAHDEEPAHVQEVIRCFADPRARLVTLSATPDGTETAEVTHEALLDHWETLREWLDANREDLRFHRHLAQDADYWERQDKADGLLWRSPDLDLLRQYHQRAGQDMTPLQVEFFETSECKKRHSKRIRRIAVTALVVLTVIAMGAAGVALWASKEANKQKVAAVHQSHISLIRSLVAYSLQDNAQEQRERAALLARQAFILNRRFDGGVDDQIEEALRTIFRTSAIQEGPGSDATGAELFDLVCQKVGIKKALGQQEWKRYVGNETEYEPACPELLEAPLIQLRSERMRTADVEALSLNLRQRQNGPSGYPIEYISNDFEDLSEVIVDHATDLMWQKAGSPKELTYADAQKYVEELNRQKFADYDDWRLPTIPELMSLSEPEEQSNGSYINPIFDKPEKSPSYWSADRLPESEGGFFGAAWNVDFRGGYVIWYSLGDGYVRCVRSWRAP